jgi:hypothetical protein
MNASAKKILLIGLIVPLSACIPPPFYPGGYVGMRSGGYSNYGHPHGGGHSWGQYQSPYFQQDHHGWGHSHR